MYLEAVGKASTQFAVVSVIWRLAQILIMYQSKTLYRKKQGNIRFWIRNQNKAAGTGSQQDAAICSDGISVWHPRADKAAGTGAQLTAGAAAIAAGAEASAIWAGH